MCRAFFSPCLIEERSDVVSLLPFLARQQSVCDRPARFQILQALQSADAVTILAPRKGTAYAVGFVKRC